MSEHFWVAGRKFVEQVVMPPVVGALPQDKTFVRVLHEVEVPAARRNVPPKMPEVRPFAPNHFSPFGKPWQLLAWKLNPLLSAANMSAIYHNELWICNGSGFGDDGDKRANFFTNTNLSAPPPKVEALTCGGNLLSVVGERTVMEAGKPVPSYIVETLNWHNPPTSVEWLEARPWLITHAVKLDTEGKPTRFGQGYNRLGYAPGVRHPFVADPSRYNGTTEPAITIPKWRCVRWAEGEAPDPYKVYL
jgi:hypothetical protein